MVFLVALQYPNGRTHEAVLDRAEAPTPGTVFEMYGRTWRVAELIDSPSYKYSARRRIQRGLTDEPTRYWCVCVD